MTAQNFLAFDLGASSGRGIVGTFKHGKLELTEIHRFENGGIAVNGRLVWNLLGLFQEIKTGIRKAIAQYPEIAGIAIDTWGVDFALIDHQGNLTAPPFHYRDSHTANVFDWVFDKVPKADFYRETGIQFMNFNTIFQLATMVRDNSAVLPIAERLLMMPNALTYLLCGDASTEYTIATTTEAYSHVTGDWAWDIIDRLDIPRDIFPEIKVPGTVVGQLTDDLCQELNCQPLPVILVGSHDTASAVASVPAKPGEKNWAFLSSGTWSLLGVERKDPLLTKAALENNFTNEGGVGETIRFLKNIMGLWLVQECRNTWKRQGQTYSFAELEKMAGQAPAFQTFIDPNDTLFAAPGDMPARIREFARDSGQPVPESPGAIIRCAMESLALRYRQTIDQIEATTGTKIERLHLVGGGCKDQMLNQFTANAIQRPVIAGPVEATAIGNLICQAMAVGDLANLEQAREVVRNSFETQEYLPQDQDQWEQAYQQYLSKAHPSV